MIVILVRAISMLNFPCLQTYRRSGHSTWHRGSIGVFGGSACSLCRHVCPDLRGSCAYYPLPCLKKPRPVGLFMIETVLFGFRSLIFLAFSSAYTGIQATPATTEDLYDSVTMSLPKVTFLLPINPEYLSHPRRSARTILRKPCGAELDQPYSH